MKPNQKKVLVIEVTFTDEKDLRNSAKYFLDGVEGSVNYLTQEVAVNNKLNGDASMDWYVRNQVDYPVEVLDDSGEL